jgi:hypothetical protein
MAAAVADGLIGTAMKRCVPGPLNRPDRTNLRSTRLICSPDIEPLKLNAYHVMFACKSYINSISLKGRW